MPTLPIFRIVVRMGSQDAHYGGELVAGAKMLDLFGDVATALCVQAHGDEGLFRAYEEVEFLQPVRAGDFIEAQGEIVRWGKTSMKMEFVARRLIAARLDINESAADSEKEAAPVAR